MATRRNAEQVQKGPKDPRITAFMERLKSEDLLPMNRFKDAYDPLASLDARGIRLPQLVGDLRKNGFSLRTERLRSLGPRQRRDPQVKKDVATLAGLLHAEFHHRVNGMRLGGHEGLKRFRDAALGYMLRSELLSRRSRRALEEDFANFAVHLGVTPKEIAHEHEKLAAGIGREGSLLSRERLSTALKAYAKVRVSYDPDADFLTLSLRRRRGK
ncbi:MAG: hypothetical protein V1787_04485 [Candidatus Micrarchaeota archaeon]